MTRSFTAFTTALLLLGTASAALAERPSFETSRTSVTKTLIPAGKLYWADDLAQLGLKATDLIEVDTLTKTPKAPAHGAQEPAPPVKQ